jgi:hypothetical protein
MIARNSVVVVLLLFAAAEIGWSAKVAPKLDFDESREFVSNRDHTKLTPNIRAVRVTVDTKNLKGSTGKNIVRGSHL